MAETDEMTSDANTSSASVRVTSGRIARGRHPDPAPTRIRRRWDRDQTPCERLVATGTLLPTQQQRLQALYSQTNPLALCHRLPPPLRRLVNGKE